MYRQLPPATSEAQVFMELGDGFVKLFFGDAEILVEVFNRVGHCRSVFLFPGRSAMMPNAILNIGTTVP